MSMDGYLDDAYHETNEDEMNYKAFIECLADLLMKEMKDKTIDKD